VGGLLEKAGYGPADGPETADVVLFHTCCVRDHAEQRLYSRISQLRRLKADRPNLVLGVGGCVAQKEKHALAERFPHVDIVFGTSAINDIVSLIRRVEQGERPVVETPEDGPEPRSHLALESDPARIHAFVSIMRGCDNYCSYCVVPYVRGAQRSKRPNEVLEEARALAGQGVVEVTLLGQNVNSYGQDLDGQTTFARLLESINEIPGLLRIRFTTSHPKDLGADLMRAIGGLSKVCEHLHLPVQSGSSRILKLMNRRYTSDQYLGKLESIRRLVPDISLTTDVIVGFPGETDEDFEQTHALVETAQFDGAYIFKYSPRAATAASRLEGALDKETIKERHRSLLEFQKTISLGRLQQLVGGTQSVLAERPDSRRESRLIGRTRGHRVASVPGGEELVGKECNVQIAALEGWTLMGHAPSRAAVAVEKS
jgi:tRNA-2-methylthio-N6-dimethylallyladenosine synthase